MKKLTIDDIEVPEGMRVVAAKAGYGNREIALEKGTHVERALLAALLWLAENPIVPSEKDLANLATEIGGAAYYDPDKSREAYGLWLSRMFLKREPEVVLIGEWPPSTCVECGTVMEAGRVRKCPAGGEMGSGFCTHHVPAAISRAMRKEVSK